MPDDLKNAQSEFVRFAQTLRGDEKSDSQTFLDCLFRALGHEGVVEANKGVFIITGEFTAEAQAYVKNLAQKVILIDGHRLALQKNVPTA